MKTIRILLFSMCCITAAVSATSGGERAPVAQAKYFSEDFREALRALSSLPTEEAPATF